MTKSHRKKIALLFLGGSAINQRGRFSDSVNQPSQVASWLREMSEIDIIAANEGFFINAGLEAIGLDEWIKAGELINQRYEEFDGFVVIHQLSTIAAGAAALSLMLRQLGKPVVLCGSPINDGIEHAAIHRTSKTLINLEFGVRANFINAAQVAVSDVAEVVIVSGCYIYRGASVVGTTDNLTGDVLGKIDFGIQLFGWQVRRAERRIILQANFDRQIMLAEYLPGVDLKQITAAAKQAHALMLSMSDGTSVTRSVVKRLRAELPPRVIITLFTAGPTVVQDGTIVIQGLSRSAAALKLMWALGQTGDRHKIQRLLKS